MKAVEWLFVVSTALFVSGIGFIIAAERSVRRLPPLAAAPPATAPVATLKQIMNGIVMPNANVVYNAVGTTMTADRVVDVAPQTEKEWAAVADSAAALVESGNLMLIGDRAVDQGDWVTLTRKFMDAARVALKAAEAKSSDGVFVAGGDLNPTCDACHKTYQR